MGKKASCKSLSTTAQTGELYTNGFSSGFIQQNKAKIVNGQWIGTNIIITKKTKKKNREGGIIEETLGDVDFLCRTSTDIPLKELFPAGSRCDISKISNIPAGTDVYIEVTSMAGKLAAEKQDDKGKTKVETKVRFYEKLFTESNLNHDAGMDLSYANKIVLFVYNGVDFHDLKDRFTSNKFSSAVIHLPLNHCIEWGKDVEIKILRALLIANGIAIPHDLEDLNDVEQTEIDSDSI